jgi:acetyltransferase-like isoleucine patch superfamily enzyme
MDQSTSSSAYAATDSAPGFEAAKRLPKKWRVILRYLTPSFVVQWVYYWRFRALVSTRAEVELSSTAHWGPGCVISSFVKIKITGPFRLGRRVQIASGCFIAASSEGLYIGDDVLIGPNCCILTSHLNYEGLGLPLKDQGTTPQKVVIGNNVWVGANSVILPGSVVGADVIVSAGSVVSGNIPPGSLVLGNPAKTIFKRR